MRMWIAAILACATLAGGACAQERGAENRLCVRNADTRALLFAVEAPAGARLLRDLAPGERLCATGRAGEVGVVSVYESRAAIEGCSRLVPVGHVETLRRYVEFDRCFWDSNS